MEKKHILCRIGLHKYKGICVVKMIRNAGNITEYADYCYSDECLRDNCLSQKWT